MSTGGVAGEGSDTVVTHDDRPSVTTSAPWLAGVRLALARVPRKQVLGAALVLLWAAWLIALWVSQPRIVPPSQLDADLEQGQVTGYAVVVLVEEPSGYFVATGRVELRQGPDDARDSLGAPGEDSWSQGTGRLTIAYWVDSNVADVRALDPDQTFPGDLDTIADRLDAAGIEDRTTSLTYSTFTDGVWRFEGALMLAGLFAVIAGPRPGRGNRWFWFWLLGLPFGLGVLALAVLEFLRPPQLVVISEPPREAAVGDGDVAHEPRATASDQGVTPKRLSGWTGFWVGILGGILVTVVAGRLADLMPLLFLRP